MDHDSFEAFATGAVPSLLRAAYLYTGSSSAAEDLVQDVLEAVYQAWPRVRDDPYGYSRASLANKAANRWRWRSRHPEMPLPADHDLAEPPASDRIVEELPVMAALRELPARQRAVVVCRFYEDRTVEETAQLLGLSTGTVKSHTARAMERLRALLDESPARLGPTGATSRETSGEEKQ